MEGEMTAASLLSRGFRFRPTDKELVESFLIRKLLGRRLPLYPMKQLDIYRHRPDDLTLELSKAWDFEEEIWDYFFVERKPESTDRTAPGGFWKVTGDEEEVVDAKGLVIGYKKNLVFCVGDTGEETMFVMDEYRVNPEVIDKVKKPLEVKEENIILCRICKVLSLPWGNDNVIINFDGGEEIEEPEDDEEPCAI